MNTSLPLADKVKGIEVLSFDHVELIKNKLGKNTFLDIGTLGVVFFPDFHRFVLFLGDWEYTLLKRIPVVSSSRSQTKSRFYNLPTYSGFYTLKFSKIAHQEAIQNLDTILSYFSKFSYYDEETPLRQLEVSPDVSLIEEEAQPEIPVSEASTITKKSSDILTSDEAKPGKLKGSQKIKKGFAKLADKLRGGSRHQANNYYLTQVLDINGLTSLKGDFAPVEYVARNDIEASIMKSKDIAAKMRFGVSPNETQFINISELRETIQTLVRNENGIEVLISQEEARILNEIENERKLQEIERQKQEEHKIKELQYIQKERELRDLMRKNIEEHKVTEIQSTEVRFQAELDRRDDMILEQARQREAERLEFKQKEQALIAEIEQRLTDLRAKDKLTEEERIEFAKREQELLEINARREAERQELRLKEKDLIADVQKAEITLREREEKLRLAQVRFKEMERDLKMRQVGLNQMRTKANLSADERVELQKREEEMERFIALKEGERLALERQAIEIESNAELFKVEIARRELLTETERIALKEKEKQLEIEAESVLAELRAKESLTDDERLEIEKKQKELKRIAEFREAERIEFMKRRQELDAQASRREAELREKEQFTEAERAELDRIKLELQKETELKEAEQRELSAKRNMLLREAERRALEIQRRANLTEEERVEFRKKEEELEKEIEERLTVLRLKEILTEEDRIALQEQEQKLSTIKEIKEVEIRLMRHQLDNIRIQEEKLLTKNDEIIQNQRVMNHEIREMQHELEQTISTDP